MSIKTVNFKVTACNKCPNMRSQKYYTADSFEDVSEWNCMAKGGRQIALQDWNDPPPPIPTWCPLCL